MEAWPLVPPLSYASEQHATDDLKKKGRVRGRRACMRIMYDYVIYGQKPQKYSIRRAGRAQAPAANEGSGNVWLKYLLNAI